jgi:uncharacterized membrane protein
MSRLASAVAFASTQVPGQGRGLPERLMGLAILVVGLAVFIGTHVFVTFRDQRAGLIARIGQWPYKALFSLASIVGVILIARGFADYRATGRIDVWYPPAIIRPATAALMWPAIVCVVAAYFPGDIKRWVKHPMLVGVKLWAFAHLLVNGDLGSIILFGSILAWAVYDRISLKHRSDPGSPPISIGGRTNDVITIIVGTIFYLALGLVFHPLVIGVPAFGTPAYGPDTYVDPTRSETSYRS